MDGLTSRINSVRWRLGYLALRMVLRDCPGYRRILPFPVDRRTFVTAGVMSFSPKER